MFELLFKQFLRTNTGKIGLLLILVLGIISIAIGKQFLNNQEEIAAQVAEKQREHIERNVGLHKEDIGLLLYYLKFAAINETSPLAGLSIGQKDVNPNVQRVRILTLEGQKYDTDLLNPIKLLFGNLDLSFVLVYVFPLLIIAFTYNLRSEEEETGTWRLVNVMSKSTSQFLLAKLSVRGGLILTTMAHPFDHRWLGSENSLARTIPDILFYQLTLFVVLVCTQLLDRYFKAKLQVQCPGSAFHLVGFGGAISSCFKQYGGHSISSTGSFDNHDQATRWVSSEMGYE